MGQFVAATRASRLMFLSILTIHPLSWNKLPHIRSILPSRSKGEWQRHHRERHATQYFCRYKHKPVLLKLIESNCFERDYTLPKQLTAFLEIEGTHFSSTSLSSLPAALHNIWLSQDESNAPEANHPDGPIERSVSRTALLPIRDFRILFRMTAFYWITSKAITDPITD